MAVYVSITNMPLGTVLDYITLELADGKEVTVDWYESEYGVAENGTFDARLKNCCLRDFNSEGDEIDNGSIIAATLLSAKTVYLGFSNTENREIPNKAHAISISCNSFTENGIYMGNEALPGEPVIEYVDGWKGVRAA